MAPASNAASSWREEGGAMKYFRSAARCTPVPHLGALVIAGVVLGELPVASPLGQRLEVVGGALAHGFGFWGPR